MQEHIEILEGKIAFLMALTKVQGQRLERLEQKYATKPCMLPKCIAPTVCHTGPKTFCVGRKIYTFEDRTHPVNLCDCERSANGIGLAGRECDCPAGI